MSSLQRFIVIEVYMVINLIWIVLARYNPTLSLLFWFGLGVFNLLVGYVFYLGFKLNTKKKQRRVTV